MFDDFCDSDGLSSNYCGNERRKTAYSTDLINEVLMETRDNDIINLT